MKAIEKTITFIIILIVAAIIIYYPITKGLDVAKSILGYGDQDIIKDTPESITSEFQKFVANYESCFNSDDNDCICNNLLLRFPPGYYISYIGHRLMEINRLKIENEQLMVDKERGRKNFENDQIVNCYVDYNNGPVVSTVEKPTYFPLDIMPRAILVYDTSIGYLPSNLEKYDDIITKKVSYGFYNEIDYDDYHFAAENKMFYKKDNNICFVLKEKLSGEGQVYINKLPQCSPKPLNS